MLGWHVMSGRIYGSSGSKANPLTIIAVLVGLVGAACSAILWLHRISPNSRFLVSVTSRLTSSSVLGDRLEMVALVAGIVAIAIGLLSVIGGSKAGAGVVVAVVLGVGAVSYPVLVSLNLVGKTINGPLK
jgi:hypothetical protein